MSNVVVRRWIVWSGWLWLVLWLTGCQQVSPVVKVGLVAPFEGAHRAIGYDVIYSARLAVREVNEAGGIGGYRVALVALDDSGDPAMAEKTAVSLTLDPAVVVVVGHWYTPTTAVAAPIYTQSGLPFIPGGHPPFTPVSPTTLSADFHARYEAVTPFDETAGPFAAPAYDAFQFIWEAMRRATAEYGQINRQTMSQILTEMTTEP